MKFIAADPAECNKLTLYFILVLGIIAISIWTLFLIQLSTIVKQTDQVVEQTRVGQLDHIKGALDARESVIEGKTIAALNVNMTKINSKNIQNILNNVSELNKKLDHQIIIINKLTSKTK